MASKINIMKNRVLPSIKVSSFILLLTLTPLLVPAQTTTNRFGWNIVLEGTRFKTLMPEGKSFYDTQKNNGKIAVQDFSKYAIGVGEPILVIDNYKGGVLAFDPHGRTVFVEDKSTLLPVTGYEYLTTGIVQEDISLLDGTIYKTGMYVLIIEQSFDKNTYKILVGLEKKVEVPISKVELVRNSLVTYLDQVESKPAIQ